MKEDNQAKKKIADAKDQVRGAELTVKEFNEAGGLNGPGRMCELLVRDDKLNPGEATRRTLQLIEKDKVNFVAGALSSAVQSAVQLSINNVTNERHIIYNSISQSDTIKRPKTGARILFMRQ